MNTGDDGDHHQSRETFLIVVVAAAFVALVLLYLVLHSLFSRCRPSRPLPPVQLLAHHRAAKFDLYPSFPSLTSFNSSELSLTTASCPSHLPYRPRWALSSSSLGSSATDAGRQTLRGVPHAPCNNVRIILPAPLAPSFVPYTRATNPSSDKIDKWVSCGRHVDDGTRTIYSDISLVIASHRLFNTWPLARLVPMDPAFLLLPYLDDTVSPHPPFGPEARGGRH